MATSTGDMTPESPDTTECLTEAYAALALAEIHLFGSLTAGKEPDEEVTEEIIKRFDQVMSVAARLALQLAPKGERAVLEEMLRAVCRATSHRDRPTADRTERAARLDRRRLRAVLCVGSR